MQFLACLLVAGLWHPITAAIAGAVYLIGRIFYFRVAIPPFPPSFLKLQGVHTVQG